MERANVLQSGWGPSASSRRVQRRVEAKACVTKGCVSVSKALTALTVSQSPVGDAAMESVSTESVRTTPANVLSGLRAPGAICSSARKVVLETESATTELVSAVLAGLAVTVLERSPQRFQIRARGIVLDTAPAPLTAVSAQLAGTELPVTRKCALTTATIHEVSVTTESASVALPTKESVVSSCDLVPASMAIDTSTVTIFAIRDGPSRIATV